MSSRKSTIRIQDILESIEKIERYTRNMTLSEFKRKPVTIDAVTRNIEVMGEACKNVPVSIQKLYPNIPWSEICKMRDLLIFAYFRVDVEGVWQTIKEDLPSLKKELKLLLSEIS